MEHSERSSVAQVKVTWDIVSFLPGLNAGKSTEAAVHKSVRKRYIAAVVMFPTAVLACGAVIWMCKKYL